MVCATPPREPMASSSSMKITVPPNRSENLRALENSLITRRFDTPMNMLLKLEAEA
jgi:hypothetical protein